MTEEAVLGTKKESNTFNQRSYGFSPTENMAQQVTGSFFSRELPPRDEWRGVLWMNSPMSPWRQESQEALRLLSNIGFVVVAIETTGIGGPQYTIHGATYKGLKEIKLLVANAKKELSKESASKEQ